MKLTQESGPHRRKRQRKIIAPPPAKEGVGGWFFGKYRNRKNSPALPVKHINLQQGII